MVMVSPLGLLDELLFLFGYPPGSGVALLRRTLPLRYCTTRFAHKAPTWSLPAPGGAALLVGLDHGGKIGNRSGVPGSGYQRVRLRRKTSVHEVFRGLFGDHSRPRVWKRLKLGVSLVEEDDDAAA